MSWFKRKSTDEKGSDLEKGSNPGSCSGSGDRKSSTSSTCNKASENEEAESPNPRKIGLPYSSFNFLGPPNLQLNVASGVSSPEQEEIELFTAATFALALQLALLVIAVVTVYHEPTKTSIRYKPPRYGLPCYIIGSVLLFTGMALCSYVIESSTSEVMWKRQSKGNQSADSQHAGAFARIFSWTMGRKPTTTRVGSRSPHLIWIQQSQRVSDQFFGSYVILGGPKRCVITSSRQEDVRDCEKSKTGKESLAPGVAPDSWSAKQRIDSMTQSESDMPEPVSAEDDEKVSFPRRHSITSSCASLG